MGANCSCVSQTFDDSKSDLAPIFRPKPINTSSATHHLNSSPSPDTKTGGVELEILPEEDPQVSFTVNKQPKVLKMLSKLKTTDHDPTREDTHDLLKKATSFFRFSSLESRYQANPVEYASNIHGDVWKLQNIRLDSIINKSVGKYLWEGHNVVNEKKCHVKITLIEISKLANGNFAKSEFIIKELSGIQHPNVIDIYSFSMFESEFLNKPHVAIVIVQEPVKCSLRDVHDRKMEQESMWTQNQVLVIIRDIYAGLAACKEKQVTHGRLRLENVLVSLNEEKALIADFGINLPLAVENRTASSTPSKGSGIWKFAGVTTLSPEETNIALLMPDEKDLSQITIMVLKMLTNDESGGFTVEMLKKDERYRKSYHKVSEALEAINGRQKPPLQVLNEITHMIDKKKNKLDLVLPERFEKKGEKESHVDVLFLKIDCYELINQHENALEIYSELIKILENKDRKGVKEYQEYVKCVNKTIKHYLTLNDWLKAKDISSELNSLLSKDEALKKTLKANPKEYITFMFLLGNISEGLGEPEKALSLYKKGLSHCMNKNLEIESYSSTLKRVVNLYMQKKDQAQALECLRKLLSYYETQEGYYVDKADGYLNMGDIFAQQGNIGQSVKLYIKSLENLRKGKMNVEALSSLVDKIVAGYKALHEDENALRYMFDSIQLKKKLHGKASSQYINEIREIAETQARLGNHQEALDYYESYQKAFIECGKMGVEYVESMMYLGETLCELKQYEKAKKSFEAYAELQEKSKGVESKEYLRAQDMIANVLFKAGKLLDSIGVQLKSMTLKEKMLKEDDIYLIVSWCNLGDTYFAIGQCKEALEYHEKSFKALEGRIEEFREEYSHIALKIALDYDKTGSSGQALRLVHYSFQIMHKEEFEVDMENTIEMYELLARYKDAGKKSLDFTKLAKRLE